MVDWSEIEKLQAAFETVQHSVTTQTLSERNCIEILMKLKEMNFLEVLHTVDGKEYLTPKQLAKEIKKELYLHGGRVNLVDLQQILNVDFSHIEAKTNDMVKNDRNLLLVYGQLLEKDYLDKLAEEINDNLQSSGQVTFAELSKTYDLPGDFLLPELISRLDTIIDGKLDQRNKDVIYTEAYIARHKARLQGTLSAVTRPIDLGPLSNTLSLSMQLLFSITESLISENRLKGEIAGGRSEKSVYLPNIYTQTQNQWIDNFYGQNNYLEFDAVIRLGISDAKSYIKKRFGNATLILKSVCIGQSLVDQVMATVEDTLSCGDWIDIIPILPSSFSKDDCNAILYHAIKELKKQKRQSDGIIFAETIVASQAFVDSCLNHFETLINLKADKEAKNASVFVLTNEERKMYVNETTDKGRKEDKKDDRRKKATEGSGSIQVSAGGAGIGAREVKTKGRDKKRLKWKKQEEEADLVSTKKSKHGEAPKFMDVGEIEDFLQDKLSHCPDQFIGELATQLHRPLSLKFESAVKSVFMQTVQQQKSQQKQTNLQDSSDKSVFRSRKQLEEDTNMLWASARLFAESFKYFEDNIATILQKHLLKEVCIEIVNTLFVMMANEFLSGVEIEQEIDSEIRIKLLSRFPENIRKTLTKLNTSVDRTFEEFSKALSDAVHPDCCEVKLKNPDKKKDRQLIHANKISLLKKIEHETDPALLLHLTSLCIFQNVNGTMINAPGKCVPSIISKLEKLIDQNVYRTLLHYQELLLACVRHEKNNNQIEMENSNKELKDGIEEIRKLASTKKSQT